MKPGLLIFALMTMTAAPFAHGEVLNLSQKDVAETILRQGPKAREVAYKYEQSKVPLLTAQAAVNWNLLLESGQEVDKAENFGLLGDFKFERYKTTFALSKPLLTGTTLGVNYARTSQKSDVTGTANPQLTLDSLGFTLEQTLWGNFLGAGTRASIAKAEFDYEATLSLRANELEDLVLEALRAFWNAYVAQENFRESLASRDRYEKLVAAVRRKTSLGYSAPGELSQVQAEYEGRVQAVKNASTAYLANVDLLITLLGLPPGSEVNFVVPKELPPVPKLSDKAIEELRIVRSQELKLKASQEDLDSSLSAAKPTLNLVGRYATTGVDPQADGSFAEMTGNTHPTYYVGVKLQYSFGSGILDEGIRARKAARALEEVKLGRTRLEERDKAVAAERKVGATYAVAQSALRQRELREKAVQELNRTYNQGRTDISVLIRALNDLFATEVEAMRALGNYQIALNEWAAIRDELIPDENQKEETP